MMVFLSYPKYYKNGQGKLVPVQTALALSSDPAWDFEVTQGNWHLKVKKDGTIQAEHEGDAFTYKFNSLGTGRGSGFKPFELGEADFSRFIVSGDTIRWSDVYPDIDLSVRYIHDILKVDVIVKNAFMADLKAEAKAGKLNQNDYLTARFDIPQVLITSKAKQNGKDKDLYAEALDVEQPIYFEKDGKVVHKLRPVEAYLLDGKGEPLLNTDRPIRTAQVWILKRNAPGVAEMSALIADLAELPEGDVVIDPDIVFNGSDPYYSAKDTRLNYYYPNSNYGSTSTVSINGNGAMPSDRYILGIDISTMPSGYIIKSASIRLHIPSVTVADSANFSLINEDWSEWQATWNKRNSTTNWQTAGGTTVAPYQQGAITNLSASATARWIDFDVTPLVRYYYKDSVANSYNNGYLLRFNGTTNTSMTIDTTDASSVSYCPELHVKCESIVFGGDAGNSAQYTNWGPNERMTTMHQDCLDTIRCFTNGSGLTTMAQTAQSKNMRLVVVYKAGGGIYSATQGWIYDNPTKEDYANRIATDLSNLTTYINDGTIAGIELGNEEEAREKWANEQGSNYYLRGYAFSEYAKAACDIIKNNSNHPEWKRLEVLSGGSIWEHKHLTKNNDYQVNGKRFIEGYLAGVTSSGTDFSKVPDTLAIHAYLTGDPPEGHYDPNVSSGVGNTVWGHFQDAITVLYNLCRAQNISPNFAITEYSNPATPRDNLNNVKSIWAPTNRGDCYTQAVYYLRSKLLHGSNLAKDAQGNFLQGVGWKHSQWFHHPKSTSIYSSGGALHMGDHGFHNPDVQDGVGTNRSIRDVTRLLTSSNEILKLGVENTSIWIPFQSQEVTIQGNLEYLAYCGWTLSDGTKWLAVWRYRQQNSFYEPSDETVSVTISGNYTNKTLTTTKFTVSQSSGTCTVYKTDVAPPVPYNITYYQGSAALPTPASMQGLSASYSGGNTTFTIPAVDENPRFVRLQ